MALTVRSHSRITRITVHDIEIELARKRIKNIYLRVSSPCGKVKVSAPLGTPLPAIESFIAAKQGWIKQQRQRILTQQGHLASLQLDRGGCYFQGQRYNLRIVSDRVEVARVGVVLSAKEIVVQLGDNKIAAEKVLEQWYRQQLQSMLPPIVEKWQAVLQVRCAQMQVRKMKTRWGSCTPATARIRINLELVKRAPTCLEYVIVHELLHLLEPAHNRRFYALLDQHLPDWQHSRTQLNALPLIA